MEFSIIHYLYIQIRNKQYAVGEQYGASWGVCSALLIFFRAIKMLGSGEPPGHSCYVYDDFLGEFFLSSQYFTILGPAEKLNCPF